jgi:hypothetical protein
VERIDWDRLSEFEQNRAEDICRRFLTNGKKVSGEWKLGDFTGASGDSLGVQLEGKRAGLWHDRATGAGGRLRKLLAQNRGISDEAAVEDIERAFGLSFRKNGYRGQTNSTRDAFNWSSFVEATTDQDLINLGTWRELTPAFCVWIKDQLLIGRYNGMWAFPVMLEGQVVAAHVRRDKHQWFFVPKLGELGIKNQPLVIGGLGDSGRVFISESTWDTFSTASVTSAYETEGVCLICTRGANNAVLIPEIPDRAEVFVLVQRDEAGEKFLQAAAARLGRPVKAIRPPEGYKDVNEWILAGATANDFSKAIDESLLVLVVPQVAPNNIGLPGEIEISGNYSFNSSAPNLEKRNFPQLQGAAFHGIIGRIVRSIEPFTEAHPAALLIQLMVGIGNMLGRNPFFIAGNQEHRTNLFTSIVGRSSKARKGTSFGCVRWVLRKVGEDWEQKRIVSGMSSGEGLIWQVRDPIEKHVARKEKGRFTGEYDTIIDDHGIDDKRLLVAETEFAQTFAVMGRERNTLSPVIRQAWDSGNLRTMVKNFPAVATGAHISIIGHITEQELKRSMHECDFFNGFANRFLWCCACRSKLLPEGGDLSSAGLEQEIAGLLEVVRWSETIREMKRDEEAREYWATLYQKLAEETTGVVGEVIARAEAQIVRLSMIFALADRSQVIRRDHLEAAYALSSYCEDSARYLFGDRIGDSNSEKILEALRATENGLTRSEINNRVFQRNIQGKTLDDALDLLKHGGFAESITERTDGRNAERWVAKS